MTSGKTADSANSALPRLIVHIGVTRTGSTALQGFFDSNRTLLPAFGLGYPRALDAAGRPAAHHGGLVAALRHQLTNAAPHPVLGAPEAYLDGLLSGVRGRRTTVLSAEGLAEMGAPAATLIAGLQARFDVTVILYLRRQDEWALSAYRAAVVDPEVCEARSLPAWLEDPATAARMDYAAMVSVWGDALGDGAIRLLRYPHETPLVAKFVAAAGLPQGLLALPNRRRRLRESVGDAELEAQLRANGGPPTVPNLSMAARDKLFERHRDGNIAVRRRFRPDLERLFTLV